MSHTDQLSGDQPAGNAPGKRQFIAGARCPQCGQLDKIVMFERDGVKQVECVKCGYARSEGEDIAEHDEADASASSPGDIGVQIISLD